MGRAIRESLQWRRRGVDDLPMGRPPSRRPRGRAAARGATLVEYSLIIAVLVFGSLSAISRLDSQSGDYYEGASDDIGDLPQSGIAPGPSTTSPSTTTTTTTTTTVPTSTTTSTTTTTVPTSTTTSTTTTTVPTTTTTTVSARSTITELSDISNGGGRDDYNAIARVRIRHNVTNNAVGGATVTIRMVDDNGSVRTRTCTTDSAGRCSVSWNRPESRSPVTATVTDVDASPPWDGVQASVLLPEP